jgi:hypothetical protein
VGEPTEIPDPDLAQASAFHALLQYEIEQASAAIESVEQQLSRAVRLGNTDAQRRHRAAERELRTDLYELHRLDRALVARFGLSGEHARLPHPPT